MILRGFGVGALAGLLAFVFARIFAEPMIQKAIDYESGRDAAQDALDRAAGLAVERRRRRHLQPRRAGATSGSASGSSCSGWRWAGCSRSPTSVQRPHVGNAAPALLALLVARGGFLGLYLVPFLKYPANPPAIGHD